MNSLCLQHYYFHCFLIAGNVVFRYFQFLLRLFAAYTHCLQKVAGFSNIHFEPLHVIVHRHYYTRSDLLNNVTRLCPVDGIRAAHRDQQHINGADTFNLLVGQLLLAEIGQVAHVQSFRVHGKHGDRSPLFTRAIIVPPVNAFNEHAVDFVFTRLPDDKRVSFHSVDIVVIEMIVRHQYHVRGYRRRLQSHILAVRVDDDGDAAAVGALHAQMETSLSVPRNIHMQVYYHTAYLESTLHTCYRAPHMKKLSDTYNTVSPVKVGEIVEGTLLGQESSSAFLDLGPRGTGIIRGREYYEMKDRVSDLDEQEDVIAKVINLETEDGFVELSFKEAREEVLWEELARKKEQGEPVTVHVQSANKGGLLTKIEGVSAFLPVSQLSSEKYPKVEDGDPQRILEELQQFVGQEMEVHILNLDPQSSQIILSERMKETQKKKKALQYFEEGQTVTGTITAICDFGAFIEFRAPEEAQAELDGTADDPIMVEGLIHISELDWQLVEDPGNIVQTGEEVQAKILQMKDEKVFLSLKALKENPWEGIEEQFSEGDTAEGTVTKINPYGAFVELAPKIQGLCHVSEFESREDMEEQLETGQTYTFTVKAVDPDNYKITLGFEKNKTE